MMKYIFLVLVVLLIAGCGPRYGQDNLFEEEPVDEELIGCCKIQKGCTMVTATICDNMAVDGPSTFYPRYTCVLGGEYAGECMPETGSSAPGYPDEELE